MQKTAIQISLTKVLVGMEFLAPSGRIYKVTQITGQEVLLSLACDGSSFTRHLNALKADMEIGKWQRVNQRSVKTIN